MGIDYGVYIGPFLRCRFHMVKQDVIVRGCTKCRREPAFNGSAFCAWCGGAVGLVTKTESVPSVHEYTDCGIEEDTFAELNQEYADESIGVWLAGNLPNDPGRHVDPQDVGLQFTAKDMNPAADAVAFEARHADNIRKLLAKFDSVEVEWGCVVTAD